MSEQIKSGNSNAAKGFSGPATDPLPKSALPVAQFAIHRYQYLNHQGEVLCPIPDFAREPEQMITLYRAMLITRLFDTKAIALQRTGQLGTYASSLGQEAIGAAIGAAMRPEDVLAPAYRDYTAQFLRGVSMTEILLYWGGDERGMDYQVPREDFPICVPVASQSAHAVGAAYAFKYRKQARVAVCVVGDGGTSKGDFYEAINIAGAWHLPVLFVINNNQWAISIPRSSQSAAETLAQKAIAAGICGEQVDGNDVIALYVRMHEALTEIRKGTGPLMIEALSYRLSDHTTADDATRYRPAGEVEEYRKYDPLSRLKRYLINAGHWSPAQDEALKESCTNEVDAAVETFLATPPLAPESMFDHLYAELPRTLQEQRLQVSRRKKHD